MIELKPCPFCGGENLTLLKPKPRCELHAYVRCNSCRAFGPDYGTEDQAAIAWNKRYEFKTKLSSVYGKFARGE